MNDTSSGNFRRLACLPLAASLMLVTMGAFAQPPSAASASTVAASDAYRSCLVKALSSVRTAASSQVLMEATDNCKVREAAFSAALLKENPDRPLFARSYVTSLKEIAVAQSVPEAMPPVTVSQKRP
jgi:hypothetical protein